MLNKEMLVPKMLPSSLRSYCLLRCLRTRSHIFMNICEVSGSSGDMSSSANAIWWNSLKSCKIGKLKINVGGWWPYSGKGM